MSEYHVKAWISVQAEDERDAEEQAADLLDHLPSDLRVRTSIEGEGSTYTDDVELPDAWKVTIYTQGDEPRFETYARGDEVISVSVEHVGTYDPDTGEFDLFAGNASQPEKES